MSKYIRPWLIFASLLVLWLASCDLIRQTPTPAANTPREQWITDWLDEPICQPPCWENITPGTTTMTEAASILNNLTGVITLGPLFSDIRNRDEISWEFPHSQSGGSSYTEGNSSIIVNMRLSIDLDQLLKVEEVIQVYSFPDHVLARSCTGRNCVVHLIYDNGMTLELYLRTKNDYFEIAEDSRVYRIWFLLPGVQGYVDTMSAYQLDIIASLIDWEGYREYKIP